MNPSRLTKILNAIFFLLAATGVAIVVFGLGLDYLFAHTSPGFSIPQLLLVAAGLSLIVVSLALRRAGAPRVVVQAIGKYWVPVVLVTLITLVALEAVLAAMGIGIYYPTYIPVKSLEPLPWWHCDEAGCRYVKEEIVEACDNALLSGRRCLVNRQGYQDRDDFDPVEDSGAAVRVLMLGDSFTAGYSADFGKSYVETVENYFPDSAVWNTAIGATGTNQAVAAFNAYAHMLQPRISVLGFYMNDFEDNITPIDSYLEVINRETNGMLMIKQYRVDVWGNVIKLNFESDLYYRGLNVDPPSSEIKRLTGLTRLGTLVLRMVDQLGAVIFEDARFNRKLQITRDYLRNLRDAAAEQDSALLVLLIPHVDDTKGVSERYRASMDLMREIGFHYLSLVEVLEPDDYALDDIHWNNAGHQKIGALLSACLETFFAGNDLSDCERVETE